MDLELPLTSRNDRTMHLEYRLSVRDYQEAYIANFKSQRTSYFFLWGLSVVVMGVGLLYLFAPTQGRFLLRILGLFFIGFGACLIPNFYYRFFMLDAWKKNPSLREPVEIRISESGITYISESIQTSIKWCVYSHFLETPTLFLIYPGPQLYGVLPKDAFSTKEQEIEFRQLLKRKIGKGETVE